MNNRSLSTLYGILRPIFLCIFLFSCSSGDPDFLCEDDFYAFLPGHANKSASNTTLPFPQQPAEHWPFRRISNAPLSRPREPFWGDYTSSRSREPSWGDYTSSRPREPSWRSHTSHRTYEPFWEDYTSSIAHQPSGREGPFGVSSERPYASRADRVEAPPRPIHVEPADMAQQDLKEGCEICCEEDAYKDYGATQCSECKKYIYQQCHDNIENAARGRQ